MSVIRSPYQLAASRRENQATPGDDHLPLPVLRGHLAELSAGEGAQARGPLLALQRRPGSGGRTGGRPPIRARRPATASAQRPRERRGKVGRFQGANTPCTSNSELSAVVSPSESVPPSYTGTWPVSQIARWFSGAEPGRIVSAVVSIEHSEPIVVSPVGVQGIAKEKSKGWVVPGPWPPVGGVLILSVIVIGMWASTSPA